MYAMMLTTLAASCAAVVGSSKSSNALVMFGINWLQDKINKLVVGLPSHLPSH